MGRPKGSGKNSKADKPEQPHKTTKETKSPTVADSVALSASFKLVDPEWAKTSMVDPKTGIHISQWRQEELRKHDIR